MYIMTKNIAESLNNILDILDNKCTDAGGEILITPDRLGVFREETDYLKERMGIEPFQAVLFAAIIASHAQGRCSVYAIGKRLGISYLRMLSYSRDLYALRDRGLIRLKGMEEIVVPAEVIDSIMRDKPFEKPQVEGLSTRVLLRRIQTCLTRVYDGEYTPLQFTEEVDLLLEANPQTSYAAACEKHKVDPDHITYIERMMFHILADLYIRRAYTVFDMGDVEGYFKDDEIMDGLRDLMDTGDLGLQILGVLEPAQEDGFRDGASFRFRDDVVRDLFADIRVKETDLKTVGLDDLADKPVKQLFYNPKEKDQIDRLGSMLEEDNLQKVFACMKEKGLRTGLICLFYGDPGTGKTETVYQMARKAGRSILEADVAKLRNCFVGETEKNMRALFRDYRTACAENDRMPILLFNEADAILGKRMEGAVRSVDRMENSVQNILLQEMESFEGILIATTNLLGNLDPAFERRFLFKVRFNKPEPEPRKQIWKAQFPILSDEEAASLAGEFSFSGGQIENVVRKYTIDSILSDCEGGYPQIFQLCREESATQSSTRTKIGF